MSSINSQYDASAGSISFAGSGSGSGSGSGRAFASLAGSIPTVVDYTAFASSGTTLAIANKPNIPSKLSQLTNDGSYVSADSPIITEPLLGSNYSGTIPSDATISQNNYAGQYGSINVTFPSGATGILFNQYVSGYGYYTNPTTSVSYLHISQAYNLTVNMTTSIPWKLLVAHVGRGGTVTMNMRLYGGSGAIGGPADYNNRTVYLNGVNVGALTQGANYDIAPLSLTVTSAFSSSTTGLIMQAFTTSTGGGTGGQYWHDISFVMSGGSNIYTSNLNVKGVPIALTSVATTGAYSDLIGKPTIPSGAYADLTGKPTIPTALSQLTNDGSFVNANPTISDALLGNSYSGSIPSDATISNNNFAAQYGTVNVAFPSGSTGVVYNQYNSGYGYYTNPTTLVSYLHIINVYNLAVTLTNTIPWQQMVYHVVNRGGAVTMQLRLYGGNGFTSGPADYNNRTVYLNGVNVGSLGANAINYDTTPLSLTVTSAFSSSTAGLVMQAFGNNGGGNGHWWRSISFVMTGGNNVYASNLNVNNKLIGLTPVATSGAYADLTGKPALATVATSGLYSDLAGQPTIPATVDYSAATSSGTTLAIANKPALKTVATTGAYADLTGKPALATVATSGLYSDLASTPTIPTTVDYSAASSSGTTLAVINKPTSTAPTANGLRWIPILASTSAIQKAASTITSINTLDGTQQSGSSYAYWTSYAGGVTAHLFQSFYFNNSADSVTLAAGFFQLAVPAIYHQTGNAFTLFGWDFAPKAGVRLLSEATAPATQLVYSGGNTLASVVNRTSQATPYAGFLSQAYTSPLFSGALSESVSSVDGPIAVSSNAVTLPPGWSEFRLGIYWNNNNASLQTLAPAPTLTGLTGLYPVPLSIDNIPLRNLTVAGTLTANTIQALTSPTYYSWSYTQVANTNTTAANPNVTASLFTYQTGVSSPYCSNNLFTTDVSSNASSASGSGAQLLFPYSGIYSLCWQARFNTTSSENSIWFIPMTTTTYSNNNNNARLAYSATGSVNITTNFTGFFTAGDKVAMNAYSAVSNFLTNTLGAGLTVTLLQRTA